MTVLLVGFTSGAEAQRLGRLFSTPEERLQLDELRRELEYGQPPEPEPEPDRIEVKVQRGPTFSQFTINGVVLRSGGGGSTWVNGTRVEQGAVTREGVRVDASDDGNQVKIVLPSGVHTIQLKAGQKIDVASGAVLEAFEFKGNETSRNAFVLEERTESDVQVPAAQSLELPGSAGVGTGLAPTGDVREQLEKLLEKSE